MGVRVCPQPEMLHGECVSVGMIMEAEVGRHLRLCDPYVVQRLQSCLVEYGLPIRLPAHLVSGPGLETVMSFMQLDKKNTSNWHGRGPPPVHCVMLQDIGRVIGPKFTVPIPDHVIRAVLASSLTIAPGAAISSPCTIRRIRVPGSKSLSNRVLMLASLCNTPVAVLGLLQSDDTQVSSIVVHICWCMGVYVVFGVCAGNDDRAWKAGCGISVEFV